MIEQEYNMDKLLLFLAKLDKSIISNTFWTEFATKVIRWEEARKTILLMHSRITSISELNLKWWRDVRNTSTRMLLIFLAWLLVHLNKSEKILWSYLTWKATNQENLQQETNKRHCSVVSKKLTKIRKEMKVLSHHCLQMIL